MYIVKGLMICESRLLFLTTIRFKTNNQKKGDKREKFYRHEKEEGHGKVNVHFFFNLMVLR